MKANDKYILNQPFLYSSIILHIISVVKCLVPEATLEHKYGIPYFYLNKKPFCYLAPNHKMNYVDVGFSRGFKLTNNSEFLVSKNRNTVKSLRYYSLEEIDDQVLENVLSEAFNFY